MSGTGAMSFKDLPDRIGMFPLDDVLLLPGGRLPLQVFEPRYRNLVKDAMASEHKLVGMIQRAVDESEGSELHPVGCAGRIISYAEADPGLYMIVLAGCCRFKIASELGKRNGYRVARPDWSPFRGDLETEGTKPVPVDRGMIKRHLKDYLEKQGLSADWEVFGKVPDHELVTSLAMVCPFTPNEKQRLLETSNKDMLKERLINLLRVGGAKNAQSSPTLH